MFPPYLNCSTTTPAASAAAVGTSGHCATPYMLARRLAALKTNSACSSSAGLKTMGVGGFFAPDLRYATTQTSSK